MISNNSKYLLVFAVSVFLILAVWASLTTRPESDEGSFASPSYNLANNGHFGTTVFDMEKSGLTRIDQRTYWIMPLFLLNASAFFKILGFSLLSMRLVSIFWGLVLLISWYFIILKLSDDRIKAALCTTFLACSYVILSTATIARPDTMCTSLGFAAFAIYLWWRERNLLLAVFVSQFLVMASGMTHFLGILAFLGLLFLTLYYDFRSIRLKHIAVAAVPYLVGGTAFGWWILQDFEAFKNQFIDNAMASGRMGGFSSPFDTFIREFTFRYPRAFGLMESSAGHYGPIFLKSLMLVGYVVGLLGVIFNKELRKQFFVILVLTGIYFVAMSLLDGQKLAVYLIYIIPFYTVLLAIWIHWMWEKGWLPRPLLILGVCGFLMLGIGGIALRARQNTFGNYYKPTVEFLNQNVAGGETVMGPAELRFLLNSNINHFHDGAFGYHTGKRPKYIVTDPGVDDSWRDSKVFFPEFYEHLPRMLKEEYQIAYENTAFKVYMKK